MAERITKIGEVVYGTQRLRDALDTLTDWLLGEVKKTGLASIGMTQLPQVADFYFSRFPAYSEEKPALLVINKAVADLEDQRLNLGELSTRDFDAAFRQVKALHFTLADLMQNIGYLGAHPESLRSRGHLISD